MIMSDQRGLSSQIFIMNYDENKAYSIPMGIKNAQRGNEFCWFSFLFVYYINILTQKQRKYIPMKIKTKDIIAWFALVASKHANDIVNTIEFRKS